MSPARPRPVEAQSLGRYRVRLRYDNGAEGVVDLSHLAGRGAFSAWDQPGRFDSVRIGARGEITWGDELELCPDALYLRLTGKRPEEVFPGLEGVRANA